MRDCGGIALCFQLQRSVYFVSAPGSDSIRARQSRGRGEPLVPPLIASRTGALYPHASSVENDVEAAQRVLQSGRGFLSDSRSLLAAIPAVIRVSDADIDCTDTSLPHWSYRRGERHPERGFLLPSSEPERRSEGSGEAPRF